MEEIEKKPVHKKEKDFLTLLQSICDYSSYL